MKLLVVNLYNMYNKGELMQLKGLRTLRPNDDISILGLYSYLDDIECKRLNIKIVGAVRPGKVLTKLFTKELWRTYRNSDLILDFGGDTFNDIRAWYYVPAHCLSLLIAWVMRKPYIIVSQSFTGFRHTFNNLLARYVLRRAKEIVVRDMPSYVYLHKLRLSPRVCHDISYVAVRTNTPYKYELKIGIAVNGSWHHYTELSRSGYINLVTELCNRINAEGYKIRLICHAYVPGSNLGVDKNLSDYVFADMITECLNYPVEISNEIYGCTHLIGFRLHPCIYATASGIPTVAVLYDAKVSCLPILPNLAQLGGHEAGVDRIYKEFDRIKCEPTDTHKLMTIKNEIRECYHYVFDR